MQIITTFNSIYCFYNEVLSNSIDPNNTYLNDNALNTDEFYQAYKGDICRYLSKTGAVTGSWRMLLTKSLEILTNIQQMEIGETFLPTFMEPVL